MSHDDLIDELRAEASRGEPGPMDPRPAVLRGRARARRRHLVTGVATLALVLGGAVLSASVIAADSDGRATDPAGPAVAESTAPPASPLPGEDVGELVPDVLGEALPPGPPVPLDVADRPDGETAHGLTWGEVDGAGDGARSVAVLVVDPGSGAASRTTAADASESCDLELDRRFALSCAVSRDGGAVVVVRSTVARDQGSDWTGWPGWVTSPPDATMQIAESRPDAIWYLRTVTTFRADGTRVTVEERVHTPDAAEADRLFRADQDQLTTIALAAEA